MSMKWLNEPSQWQQNSDMITVVAEHNTDFWRITRHNFTADNGHFYFREVDGDFVATVKVSGAYATLYDQAGLMVRKDSNLWMKCGIEFLESKQYASAVVTRGFSDWSVVPLPDNPESSWFRVTRQSSTLEVEYSADGENYYMIRQAYLTDAPEVSVGIMCAAPKGKGFKAVFEHFQVQ